MERESRSIEYKRQISDFEAISRTVAAFANGDGGQVIVGVDDKSRSVVGLSPSETDSLLEKLPVSIVDRIQPSVFPQVFERTIEGKEVVVVQVFPGSQKPYFIASEGMEKGVYIRVGAHTRRASGEVLEELRLLRSHVGYDQAPVPECQPDELDLSRLPAHLRANKVLLSFEALKHDRFSGALLPSRGGILMLHPQPQQYVNEAFLVASKMRGNSGRDTLESHEITGSLGDQLEKTLALLETWLAVEPRLKGARYVPGLRLPFAAVREALSNALFHRQYSIPGPIKVACYADRLEIFSPGHFAGPFVPDALGDGASYIRNKVIALLARRLQYIEKRGTGIKLIQDAMASGGHEAPRFIEGQLWFKVVLPFSKRESTGARPEEKILGLLETRTAISSNDVRSALKVSKATAVGVLERMIVKGSIVRTGNGPSTRYTVSGF